MYTKKTSEYKNKLRPGHLIEASGKGSITRTWHTKVVGFTYAPTFIFQIHLAATPAMSRVRLKYFKGNDMAMTKHASSTMAITPAILCTNWQSHIEQFSHGAFLSIPKYQLLLEVPTAPPKEWPVTFIPKRSEVVDVSCVRICRCKNGPLRVACLDVRSRWVANNG